MKPALVASVAASRGEEERDILYESCMQIIRTILHSTHTIHIIYISHTLDSRIGRGEVVSKKCAVAICFVARDAPTHWGGPRG